MLPKEGKIMTIAEIFDNYRNDLYNILLVWIVKRTYLRVSTIWEMMRRIDTQTSRQELEFFYF